MVVASYLVELAGPCGKACIMGPQAMVSLGSVLKCIFLEQKERASWDDILTRRWGWRVLIWNQIGVGCDSVIHKPCGVGGVSFPLSEPWVSYSIKREEGYFTMMLWVDNKIISIKPVVKCPEDKSHLIHCVLTCNAPLCPKEATELLFIWTLCQALTCPLSSQALLQTYCHNKQYRKHLEVCLAQKEGKKNLWGLWKAGAHITSGTPGTHQILSPEIGRQN